MTIGAAVAAGAAALSTYGVRELLTRQAAAARRVIGKPLGEAAPDADRVWKSKYGDPLDLLLLGDSIAAGLGAERPKDTLGARLAKGVAKRAHRSVRLTTVARVGSESSVLPEQLAALPATYRADVAVIVVGGNDVTHRVPVPESVRHLEEAIARLRSQGTAVVVGTCPDLGALRPVPQPLRSLGSRMSRQLAAAQREAAVGGGRARGVARARRRPLLHHQPRRDVQPGPVPPERDRLPADGEGTAAVGARRGRARRRGAVRAPSTGLGGERRRLGSAACP